MIEELFYIEKSAYRDSFIHQLDARVKILGMFAIIIAMVAVPYSPLVFTVGLLFFAFIAALWALSGLPWLIYVKRLIMVLPFGLFIILFQIFFTNRYYPVFHVIANLPLGIHIYAESVEFAFILLVKFIVCVSAIILLSSTTKLQDMLEGAGRMGLPPEFALTFGMMIRYLFVFGYIFRKINESLITRCFDPFDPALTYRYRIKQIGYTVGTIFVRSYEQGERVYTSMLCRGYGKDSHIFHGKKAAPCSRVVIPCLLPALCHCRPGHGLAECSPALLIHPSRSLRDILRCPHHHLFYLPVQNLRHGKPVRARVHHEHHADCKTFRAAPGTGMARCRGPRGRARAAGEVPGNGSRGTHNPAAQESDLAPAGHHGQGGCPRCPVHLKPARGGNRSRTRDYGCGDRGVPVRRASSLCIAAIGKFCAGGEYHRKIF